MTRWRCPTCGRDVRTPDQVHSCGARTIDEHFAGRPAPLREAFDALVAACLPEPAARVEPLRTTIHLMAGRAFAMATPRRDTLKVSVLLARRVEAPRIERHETLSASRHVHTLLVRGPGDVDAQLVAWLREAQALAG